MYINNSIGSNVNSSNISITVNGDLYLTDGSIASGTIKVDGDLIAADTWDGGLGVIEWQKAGNETWAPNINIMYPILKFTLYTCTILFCGFDVGVVLFVSSVYGYFIFS